MVRRIVNRILICVAALSNVASFLPASLPRSQTKSKVKQHLVPVDAFSSSLVTSVVEYFDGSTIVDPTIVSDVYWQSLGSRIVSVVIAQVLVIATFAVVSWVASKQIGNTINFIALKIFGQDRRTEAKNIDGASGQRLKVPPNLSNVPPRSPDFGKLFVCVIIDIVGSSSELLPIIGELSDVVYAPIAALLLRKLYNSNVIFALEFVEEIWPFTDILPLATICWTVDTFAPDSDVAKFLNVGNYGNSQARASTSFDDGMDAIDVNGEVKSPAKKASTTIASRDDGQLR